jgi:FkbM family methyltransferase
MIISYLIRRIREEPDPVRFIASRLLWRTGLCSLLTIPRQGYDLTFFPTDMSAALWLNRHYSDQDRSVIGGILRPGDTFVDVGANVGELSLFAAQSMGKRGFVVSIEAHPKTFSYLRRNIDRNPHLTLQAINAAAGNYNGKVNFTSRLSDGQNCVSAQGRCCIPTHTLDELLGNLGTIRLLKIDVEGYEKFVLEGAINLLTRTEYVYFEAWDRHAERYCYKTPEIAELLRSAGFQVPEFDASKCCNVLAAKFNAV